MGIIKLDAYVLLISGQDRYTFLDGLSTNKVDSSCSTVLTTTSAKIIDVLWGLVLNAHALNTYYVHTYTSPLPQSQKVV